MIKPFFSVYDISNVIQKEIDTLKATKAQRDAELLEAPAQPPVLLAQSPPIHPPRGPVVRFFDWTCDRCKSQYKAPRNQTFCQTCLPLVGEELRKKRRAELHYSVLKTAGKDFEHVHLAHPKLKLWVNSPKAIEVARARADLDYDEEAGHWCFLVLLGETGLGKTTLGTAVFRHQLDRLLAPDATKTDEDFVRGMLWISARKIALARRETPLGRPVELLEQATNATVLLLDDLGQEHPDLKDDLIEVLSERQRCRRKTIVTCGLSLNLGKNPDKSIEGRYGPQIARRLGERVHVLDLKALGRGQILPLILYEMGAPSGVSRLDAPLALSCCG